MPIQPPTMPPPPSRAKKIRRIAMEIGIALAIVFAFGWWQTRNAVKGVAPELPAVTFNTSPTSAVAGPTLVYFWATWCGVCSTMRGTIEGLAEDHRVVTVASQSGTGEDVAKYLKTKGVTYPTVLDDEGDLAQAWRVGAFPTIYVLDANRNVRFVEVGWSSSLGLNLRLWWAGL